MAEFTSTLKEHLQELVDRPIENWHQLENLMTLKKFKKGEHFFQHFDHCDEVALVSHGLFRIYLTDSEGEEKTYSFIPENSFILDFFLTWEQSSRTMVSVQALEDSELYTVKYKNFLELMNLDSIWHQVYREVLLRNYMFKTKREMEFVQFNAKQRLEKFISNKRLDVQRIPKTYLASYLGIQPPSLSRLLRELRD